MASVNKKRKELSIQTLLRVCLVCLFATPAFASDNFLRQLLTSCAKNNVSSWTQNHRQQHDVVLALIKKINSQVRPSVPTKTPVWLSPEIPKSEKIPAENFIPQFRFFEEQVRYLELSKDVRRVNGTLLYGKSFGTIEEAYNQLSLFFRNGRVQKKWDSDSIVEYATRMDYNNQSYPFLGTSHETSQALVYARKSRAIEKPKFGVVYLIDPKNAPVLDLTKFAESRGLNPEKDDIVTFWNEREVVFSSQIPPNRFLAAFIVENDVRVEPFVYRQEVRYVLLNPNYSPASF